jgi:hypothetical protein
MTSILFDVMLGVLRWSVGLALTELVGAMAVVYMFGRAPKTSE